jgi:hypothetical protein
MQSLNNHIIVTESPGVYDGFLQGFGRFYFHCIITILYTKVISMMNENQSMGDAIYELSHAFPNPIPTTPDETTGLEDAKIYTLHSSIDYLLL